MKSKLYTILCIFGLILYLNPSTAQNAPCPTPGGVSNSNLTSSSANVSWNQVAGAVLYNVRYRPVNQPGNAWLVITTQVNNAGLLNLLCNTLYECQVQAGCPGLNGALTLSTFSSSSQFTTLSCTNVCPVPTGLYANNITSTSAKLHWNSTGATSYRVRYRQVGTLTWTLKYPSANNVTINGLSANQAYEWQVRSRCVNPSGVVLSAWSNTSVFQTPGLNTCPTPTNLTSSSIGTTNSRLLNWNASGAISYNIRYRPANTIAWINTTSATNSKTITGLLQNVNYEWQVQSVCANPNGVVTLSAWSASAYFTTPSPMEISPNPATDDMFINYQSRGEQSVTVTVHDYMGNILQTQNRKAYGGENEYKLNISSLKTGMYYILVSGPEGQQAERFCVKR